MARTVDQNLVIREKSIKKITEVALLKFSTYGYHSTTIRKVTNDTNISYGNIYHYFKSKDELFMHLVSESQKNILEIVSNAVSVQGNAWVKLENLAKSLVGLFKDSYSWRFFVIELEAITQARHIEGIGYLIKEAKEKYNNILQPIIVQGQKDGDVIQNDPLTLVVSFFSLFQGLAIYVLENENWAKIITEDTLLFLLKAR